jgi:hypothetical protein
MPLQDADDLVHSEDVSCYVDTRGSATICRSVLNATQS